MKHPFHVLAVAAALSAAAAVFSCSDSLSDIIADGGVLPDDKDGGTKPATTCKNNWDCKAGEKCEGGKCVAEAGEDAGGAGDVGDVPDTGCQNDAFCKGEGEYCDTNTGVCVKKAGVISVTCGTPPADCGELNFGSVQYGDTIQKDVTVKNVGTETLKVTDVYLESGSSATFSLDPALVKQHDLAPSDGFAITITYQQDDNLPDNGSLIVSSMDLAHPTVRVLLRSEPKGTVQVAVVDASQQPPEVLWPAQGVANWLVDFGTPPVGQKAVKTFTLANLGDPGSVLAISKVEKVSLGPDFTVVAKELGNEKTLPAYLNQGDMIDVEIAYDVKNNNPVMGGVQVTSSDLDADDDPATEDKGVFEVKVNAAVVPPQILVDPLTVDFGHVQVAQPVQKVFKVSNVSPGSVNLAIKSIGLQAGNADFDFAPKQINAIAPQGGFVDVTVTYTPSTTGDDFDRIAIESDDPANPKVEVQLSGRGIDPILDISPKGDVDFGDVPVGNAAQPVDVTVTKVGEGQVRVDSVALTAGTNASYVLSDLPQFPVTLVNDQDNFSFKVQFKPATMGAITGAFEMKTDSPKYATVTKNIKGNGVDCCVAKANATGVCDQQTGLCAYSCKSGYADLDGDLNSAGGTGCECQLDAYQPNNTCAEAKNAGVFVDRNKDQQAIQGNIVPQGADDWFVFFAQDESDPICQDSFHIEVTLDPGGQDYDLMVCKSKTETCPPTDCRWSTKSGTGTESVVTTTADGWEDDCPIFCCGGGDNSGYFYVRVFPKNPNAAPVCGLYTLTLRNGKH
ncbi:MAG: choice-of-anchor D domain-containing protein [Deltaproteobacteria bacterium]|nr:choice-of-anchor D domain-containing protein [Deltaproteobacteria bacterium]